MMKILLSILTLPILARSQQLYFKRSSEAIPVNLGNYGEPLTYEGLKTRVELLGLPGDALSELCLDSIVSPRQLLELPIQFFHYDLTQKHIVELAKNRVVNRELLSGGYLKKNQRSALGQDADLLKRKLVLIYQQMRHLSQETIGPMFDELLEAMRTKLYGYLDPMAALASSKFKASTKGFKRLFHVSYRTARSKGGEYVGILKRLVKELAAAVASGRESVLTMVTRIGFELLIRNVPLPNAVMRRIAAITMATSCKAREVRLLQSKLLVTEEAKDLHPSLSLPELCAIHDGLKNISFDAQQIRKRMGNRTRREKFPIASIIVLSNSLGFEAHRLAEVACRYVMDETAANLVTDLMEIANLASVVFNTVDKAILDQVERSLIYELFGRIDQTSTTIRTRIQELSKMEGMGPLPRSKTTAAPRTMAKEKAIAGGSRKLFRDVSAMANSLYRQKSKQ